MNWRDEVAEGDVSLQPCPKCSRSANARWYWSDATQARRYDYYECGECGYMGAESETGRIV
jgi:hypothetical protein